MLVTQARDNGKLQGFSFCTLERIGGTPCLLVGLGVGEAHRQRDTVLKALDGRPVPPGRAGLPRRGRPRRHQVHRRRRATPPSRAWRTSSPAPTTRPPARSGHGAAAWPSASAPRAASTTGPSWSRGDGSAAGCLDHEAAQARGHRPGRGRVLRRPRPRPGRLPHRLRLGHGRGSRRAASSASRQRPGSTLVALRPVYRRYRDKKRCGRKSRPHASCQDRPRPRKNLWSAWNRPIWVTLVS